MKVEDIKNLSKDTSLNDSYKVEQIGCQCVSSNNNYSILLVAYTNSY